MSTQRDIETELIDPSDPDWISKIKGHLIYCVGATGRFLDDPIKTFEANTKLLADALVSQNYESLTYLSSTRLYHSCASTSENTKIIVNSESPDDLYTITKLAGESLCTTLAPRSSRILRLSNVVSASLQCSQFHAQLINAALTKKHIKIQSTLDSEKDYIYLDDVVTAILNLISIEQTGIINVGSGMNSTNAELINWIEKELGLIYSIDKLATTRQLAPIDIQKVRSMINFRPTQLCDFFPKILNSIKT